MTTAAQPLAAQPDPMLQAFTARAQQSAPTASPNAAGGDPMVQAFQQHLQQKQSPEQTTSTSSPSGYSDVLGRPANEPAQQPPNPHGTIGPSNKNDYKVNNIPFARVLMDAVDKLREVENFSAKDKKEHPLQGELGTVANRIEGFLFGNEQHPEDAIGSGKYGMLNNPVTGAILPGSKGTPALAEGIEGGVNAVKGGIQALRGGAEAGEEAATKGPSLVKQVMKGKEVAQEPAQTAIREATGAEKGTKLLEGNKSIVDEKIQDLFGQERSAYAKQDKVAGFDMKSLHEKLDNTEEQIRNLTDTEEDVAKEAKLEKSRTAIMDKIGEAEGKLKGAGIDPEEAKNIFKQRKAAEDFKKAIVQHSSSDGQSVNVDGLLESAKKMRFNKYGDRLAQMMGDESKADEFMHKLEAAQDLGNHAVTVQKIAKWLGGIAGIGAAGEAIHLAKEVVQ